MNIPARRDNLSVVPDSVNLTLSYGPTSQKFNATGKTLGEFLGDGDVGQVMGFSNAWDGNVLVNGQPATRDYQLQPGDNVEVIKRAGDKG
ncbi:MAG: hypothetical protein A2878_02970 [Candidatus Moranbacteria bacterium RIFCSPHIGHO2_01_FULL_54_31]|nr:MAG: hypothetical protein A2878_02970 [Candidatus Moranbacteria bacterium RIFCSPHIGHO2_01_FULL_54_31]